MRHERPIQLTLDTGATSNMIRASSAIAFEFPVLLASLMAPQADGVTPMEVVGEVHCSLIATHLLLIWIRLLYENSLLRLSKIISLRLGQTKFSGRTSQIVMARGRRFMKNIGLGARSWVILYIWLTTN